MANPISGEWQYLSDSRDNSVRLSLAEFLTHARKFLTKIVGARDSVEYAYELLSEQEKIWPDQCDYGITSIRTMGKSIDNFCTLLDKVSSLPVAIISLRYQLVAELYYVQEQIQELDSLLTAFRSNCQEPSQQTAKQRAEILQKLELVLQGEEDIVQETNVLFDQARFQERK